MLKVEHNAGFFSCCSIKLVKIVEYINENKKLPDKVDSSVQFMWYKNDSKKDITFDYFKHYDKIPDIKIITPLKFVASSQFMNYNNIDYNNIIPIVKKYFSPSDEINKIILNLEKKYNLEYNNLCVLFYRGNDKNREIKKCGYEEYLEFANKIQKNNPKIKFLIQSDETEFIDFFTKKYPHNSFYFKDEIRHINKCDSTVDLVLKSKNYEFSKYFLGITIIMSKCKYIICGSGNCDMWIMMYRENNKNVIQRHKQKWIDMED